MIYIMIYPVTDPNGAGIYGVPWIPSTKTPMNVSINLPAPWIRHDISLLITGTSPLK